MMPDAPRLVRITWQGYRVPFARPFATAHGVLTHREGLIVTLAAENGLAGVGEAAPWPLFALGDVADAARSLRAWAPGLVGQRLDDLPGAVAALSDIPDSAAARCALDLAAHDLLGRWRGTTVATLLGGTPRAVAVNATLGALPPEEAAETARRAVAAGFDCVKVKVAAGSLADDVVRVAAIRAAIGPGVRLRLDANGGWTVPEALDALDRLARYGLELVEQPVAADDLAGLAQVRASTVVPIAADEAAHDLASARAIIAADAADVLVVKPMTAGGLQAGRAIIELTQAAGLGAIVTTTIDCAPGIAGALALAACLPAAAPACGLATAPLLATDLSLTPLPVAGGQMMTPDVPGLGVRLRLDAN
ncbi:MAG: mandelate racemase/muconate lactonizing enzyme family protein, partial [Thermomicrobiales bacterium]